MAKSKAVIIAVNDYAPVGEGGPDLNGCVNDAEDVANTLLILGWPKSTIRIATNKRATTSRIKKLLDWLVRDAKAGDRLFFYYSGHGSQVPDVDLDGAEDDETDNLDEIICPHDLDWEGTYVSDDDFARALKNVHKDANCDMFLDCCYSGSATKTFVNPTVSAFNSASRDVAKKVSKYLSPPLDFRFHLGKPKATRNPIVSVTKDSNHALWSAGQEFQTVVEYDIDGNVRGAATYHFCQILRRSNGDLTREQLYTLWADALARAGEEQVPRIDANPRLLGNMPFRKTSNMDKYVNMMADNAKVMVGAMTKKLESSPSRQTKPGSGQSSRVSRQDSKTPSSRR